MTRFLGIDYGEKRLGLALGDDESWTAAPFEVIQGGSHEEAAEKVHQVVTAEGVGEVVVGMPLTLSGEPGPQAEVVEDFVTHLEEILGVPVSVEDERLTTVKARREGADEASVDAAAAAEILQTFLDRRKRRI